MRLAYLYNEILPTGKAHDAYVWRNCISLAEAGEHVTLACGRGSGSAARLAEHYATALPPTFTLAQLPIVRRSLGLPFTWNRVFDWAAQRKLAHLRPDAALLSVRKQGAYHLARKIPGVRYIYEVHELAWYPTCELEAGALAAVREEREMLSRADLVTVTTPALEQILLAPPYELRTPIAIVPLAITASPAPPAIAHAVPLHAMYIGQLYSGQGVEDLLAAAARIDALRLTVVGGPPAEVERLRARVPAAARPRIEFTGFVPPARLSSLAATAHAFVAPFRPERRMPFVAHTKLLEYVALRRPVVAPALPIVEEEFPGGAGLESYAPDDASALEAALRRLLVRERWEALMHGVARLPLREWSSRSSDYAALLATR